MKPTQLCGTVYCYIRMLFPPLVTQMQSTLLPKSAAHVGKLYTTTWYSSLFALNLSAQIVAVGQMGRDNLTVALPALGGLKSI
jgi:hypothetical protein